MPLSIERSKNNQFFCRITAGKNGKKLHNGETVTRKSTAINQLIAVAKEFGTPWIEFVDNTILKGNPKVHKIQVK